ncbi:hypothetical protein [Candidatus Enterococcus murrayae]|uniref:Uncharacterized protein n=1 Tax=Candidatus Enterococcus murrayae TaxID=2815321 RepID=A0ABS3HF33_9ENTE|nr:hypothetical protein [Enterococcus sp. MJM16]MBO0452066.1 hypothetical protein [Enterococcus sp. MJM16]
MKKIIALDIDQFRVGISGSNYREVFSSLYSTVKKNTWKPSFFKDQSEIEGSEIKLEELSEPILWGLKKRQSRRSKAYHSFGDVLNNLEATETRQLVWTVLAYLAGNQRELFEEISENQLSCSLCIGVNSKSSMELSEMEHKFEGEYKTWIDGAELSILVNEVVLAPKSFCTILENEKQHATATDSSIQSFDGLNYIIDVSDHNVKCDIYDNGELIKSENISHGIYEFSDRIVQEYKTNCVQNNTRSFQIDRDMVYNMITSSESTLVVNGRQQIDLTALIDAEIAEETKKVLSYLTKDQDVQYADNIIVRDLSRGIINQETVNQYLENFGLNCVSIENKSAQGIYTFGTIFFGDDFLDSNDEDQGTQSENALQTVNSEKIEQTNDMETSNAASVEVEMAVVQGVDEHVADSEQHSATIDDTGIQDETIVEASEEIEDILKEQNELLSSLIHFEDNSL